jgi:segregation and condensation protein A
MQDKLFNMLMDENEITWQSIIYELVKKEEMDPWDIDVSKLAEKYLEAIRELEEHSFFISGKILHAAAIMLRLKSIKLVDEHIADFDSLLFQKDEDLLDDNFYSKERLPYDAPPLLVKTPQQRKRKVNLNDLMKALNEALRVEEKRIKRKESYRVIRAVKMPIKKFDISEMIKNVLDKIKGWFGKKERLTFSELVGSDDKEEKIKTFIPMLHLVNDRKIDVEQEVPFGEIDIVLRKDDIE